MVESVFCCPFCPCVFVSEYDLEVHLDCFGHNAVLHGRNFRRINVDFEETLSYEHGGADKIIRVFENLILYGTYRKPSDRKLRLRNEKRSKKVGLLDGHC